MSYRDEFMAMVERYGELKREEGELLRRLDHLLSMFETVKSAAASSHAEPSPRPRRSYRKSNGVSHGDRVLAILRERGSMSRANLSSELVIADNALGTVLSRLKETGHIESPERGIYRIVNSHEAHETH